MSESYPGREAEPKEIERKFLLSRIPEDVEVRKREAIRQGYVAIGVDGTEVRLRDRDGVYTQTIKSKGDLVRGELEANITEEQFTTWWPATAGKRIEKIRYSIAYGEHTIELDDFGGALRGMLMAEVEFASATEADTFEPPSWFISEVTYDANYKNQNLAMNGRPYDFTG
jgi:adenylate cyclase